jgi:hypothetical protein
MGAASAALMLRAGDISWLLVLYSVAVAVVACVCSQHPIAQLAFPLWASVFDVFGALHRNSGFGKESAAAGCIEYW